MIYFVLPRTYLYTYKNIEYIECNTIPEERDLSERKVEKDNFSAAVEGNSYVEFDTNSGKQFRIPEEYTGNFTFTKEIGKKKFPKFSKRCSDNTYISNSLSYYLNNIKECIDDHNEEWDVYKKYTNPYEFIHTNIPNKKKNISKYKPLSRSYYKMIEIVKYFHLIKNDEPCSTYHFEDENWKFDGRSDESNKAFFLRCTPDNLSTLRSDKLRVDEDGVGVNPLKFQPSFVLRTSVGSPSCPIRSFHLAEGPGGFIEAFLNMRNNPFDTYIGMTILDDKNDTNIPSWKKSGQFMREHCNNVFIERGADQTGNILSLQNFVHCKTKYESSMDFITADGGFDFSSDFKNQENSVVRLLFAQIAYAVCMQKYDGSFVLKIFDCFMLHTIDLLYLLSSFYKNVYICKPQTSRYANSEKYVVCKNFIHKNCVDIYPYLHDCFEKMMKPLVLLRTSVDFPNPNGVSEDWSYIPDIGRFLNIQISNNFINKLEEYNSILGQQQIENIHDTIVLIESKYKNEKINNLLKTNIRKCTQWCIKYNMPYNLL
jgi:23S rRNA U2552 (ribose-2'-O)-methylase RlmE/FtsJ